jgi:hypothetical protein
MSSSGQNFHWLQWCLMKFECSKEEIATLTFPLYNLKIISLLQQFWVRLHKYSLQKQNNHHRKVTIFKGSLFTTIIYAWNPCVLMMHDFTELSICSTFSAVYPFTQALLHVVILHIRNKYINNFRQWPKHWTENTIVSMRFTVEKSIIFIIFQSHHPPIIYVLETKMLIIFLNDQSTVFRSNIAI